MTNGWWSDLLRTPWAYLYWNYKKSRWLAGGRSGRCPCLNPSDPHGPRQARCEAVVYWARPERFQKICPLLERDKGEWRCSGGRKHVRAFWGRAIRFYALTSGALLVAVVLALQGVFWMTGVRGLTPLDIILPGRWDNVQSARAEAFRRLAITSMQSGDYQQVLLALATAEDTAPGTNLATGLITLRLAEQSRQHVVTDKLFARLTQAYPNDHGHIAIILRDALLISGRWPTLAELSLAELDPRKPEAGPWLRTLALAADSMPQADSLIQTHADRIDALPAAWNSIVRRLLDDPHAQIEYPPEHAELFATIAIEHATRAGDTALAAEAFGILAAHPDAFRDLRLQNRFRLRYPTSSRDPYALRLTLIDFAKDDDTLQLLIPSALRARDTKWLAAVTDKFSAKPSADCAGDLWLAATLLKDAPLQNRAEALLPEHADYFALVRAGSHGASSWSDWITVIPCSREMLFTLAELRPQTPNPDGP